MVESERHLRRREVRAKCKVECARFRGCEVQVAHVLLCHLELTVEELKRF